MTVILHASKRTIQERPKILHIPDIVIGRATGESYVLPNLLTKTLENLWVLAKQVHAEGEGGGGLRGVY